MTEITIEIINLKEIQAVYKKFPKIAGKQIKLAIKSSLLDIEGRAKSFAPVDTGGLGNDTVVDADERGGSLIFKKNYAVFVHEGRAPGSFPPFKKNTSLEKWARRKGIPAFLVARKIAKKGTKANPFLKKAVDARRTMTNNRFRQALFNITKSLAVK